MLDALSAKKRVSFFVSCSFLQTENRKSIGQDAEEHFMLRLICLNSSFRSFSVDASTRTDQMEFMVYDLSAVWILELVFKIWVFRNSRHGSYSIR